MKSLVLKISAVSCFLVTLLLLTGCGTPETANKSERPWNSPKSWENGLPSGINEGR